MRRGSAPWAGWRHEPRRGDHHRAAADRAAADPAPPAGRRHLGAAARCLRRGDQRVHSGGNFGDHYHTLDKLLDTYYLSLELVVALRWQSPYARLPAVALFVFRLAGVALFETTHRRVALFIFPNLFENWWLYVVAVERLRPRWYPRSVKGVIVPLLLLLIPNGAESMLHFAEAGTVELVPAPLSRHSIAVALPARPHRAVGRFGRRFTSVTNSRHAYALASPCCGPLAAAAMARFVARR
ncbi:MAG: hypothetical protein U0531_16975 [Dehalococcoidia bacterium]